MDSWRRIAVCVGQALLYQQFGDLFAVARRFRAFAEHQAFGHSQTAEAASFRRALFTPGTDESLGPPHALAAPMRLRNRPSRTIGANFVFMAPASVAWLAGY